MEGQFSGCGSTKMERCRLEGASIQLEKASTLKKVFSVGTFVNADVCFLTQGQRIFTAGLCDPPAAPGGAATCPTGFTCGMQSSWVSDAQQSPFAIVVSNATVGATVHPQRLAWLAWAGDGLPHPAPDGTGQYWFPAPLPINYVIVPTGAGDPLIIFAPEVMVHPTPDRPPGHPTMGACPGTGGTPVAFLGGTIEGTTKNLRERLQALSCNPTDAVFHAAAVSDFMFGKIWVRSPDGELIEIKSGKVSPRAGTLLAELVPTTKIIAELRGWYPKAKLIGWKYEVDGNRADVLSAVDKQMTESGQMRVWQMGALMVRGLGS